MQVERTYRILLIRHGITAGNLEKRFNGCRTDEPLTLMGREALLERGAPEPFVQKIFSGPMKRCVETAECLYPGRDITILPGMKELDFGRFEGKNHAELDGDPDYQAWLDSGGRMVIPEGDSPEEFLSRTRRIFMEMLQRLPGTGESPATAALICHGGNIMSIMSSLTGGDYFSFLVKNGEGYELTFSMTGETIHDLSYHGLYTGESAGPDHRGSAVDAASRASDGTSDRMA